ncbi:DUF1501 domain-containing protein [Planctobacterium marinum]|uniref:Tat (Twin-arginine translocation) pathway signal sequence domain protein n=1 Tax=Planctobacterium marinum TaxID=1631968 RepID=A0AA48KRK6_9ALTE|nr:hypothetical protein MACH26_10450 [Planctobacterium marinum]
MNRRHFFKTLGLTSVAASLPASFNLFAAPADYTGKFLITIQAEGGWDVTSFCDPKINTSDIFINNWASNGEPGEAGNLHYAAFANNQWFFDKYYQDMLVINGVDAQTNSHTAGVVHNWSGRLSDGFPSLTALFAAQYGSSLPVAYISNGGYSATGGLTRYTQLDNIQALNNVIYPNRARWGDNNYLHDNDWARIEALKNQRLAELQQAEELTTLQQRSRDNFAAAVENGSILSQFSAALENVGDLQEPVNDGNFLWSSLSRQAQVATLAMGSGVCVSADLIMGGYDTHENHDAQHDWLFTELARSIDFLWTYAEQQGIADRLVVMVGSDFGRTPHYNDGEGKDHWPISSYIVMEKGAAYTNRTVGMTDEGHNVIPINPTNWQSDEQSGSIIHPAHVMTELREYLGLDALALQNNFLLSADTRFGFFDS